MKFRILAACALLAAVCLAQQPTTRTQVIYLGKLTATGVTNYADLQIAAHTHTIQAVVTGGPAACSIQLEGTLDDPSTSAADWADLSGSQTCTSTVTFHVIDRAVRGVRANLTALSGGTAPTVTVKYMGVQ